MSTLLTLGHSPDSDDAFMFYGLANKLVDTEGLEFEHILRDIETLNQWAKEGKLDFTAISVHAYAYVKDKYAILTHGASMGDGYGPIVVSNRAMTSIELNNIEIAVPGELTSAFLALSIYLDQPFKYRVMPFDQIMDAVKRGDVDAGLIIHEGQLTHGDEGLHNVVDLGAWWKIETCLPLPLGVNTIRRDLPEDIKLVASRVLKSSIEYSLNHRTEGLAHAMQFARDMKLETADAFVGMYVNHWTVDMGEAGKDSIKIFLNRALMRGLIPDVGEIDFVD